MRGLPGCQLSLDPDLGPLERTYVRVLGAPVNGLRIRESGGNLVTNDLHYAGSIHDYIGRRKAGMDVRIVKHRDWRIDLRDMEKVVDKKTKLVSITLV